jgi:transcriptional regulator with XRE-family HTH domain
VSILTKYNGDAQLETGQRLKALRRDLGISTRQVEKYSRQIATAEGRSKFYISNAWLSQIEATGAVPSVQKLFSLSVIYRINFVKLLYLFGIDLERIVLHQLGIRLPKTHPARLEVYNEEGTATFPARFHERFKGEKTTLLSRMVKIWGEIPISIIRHLDIRNSEYGYVGLRDHTMDPLIPPGSFVQIDNKVREVLLPSSWRTELDRPIYFVKIPGGYACSWCELKRKQLTLVAHPLSRTRLRHFAYTREAEIIGRVTGIAMRIVRPEKGASDVSVKSSKPS